MAILLLGETGINMHHFARIYYNLCHYADLSRIFDLLNNAECDKFYNESHVAVPLIYLTQ